MQSYINIASGKTKAKQSFREDFYCIFRVCRTNFAGKHCQGGGGAQCPPLKLLGKNKCILKLLSNHPIVDPCLKGL